MTQTAPEEGRLQTRIPPERVEQAKRLALMIGAEPFHRRSWAELGFFIASSALAVGAVAVLSLLGAVGLVLTVALVGVVILSGGLRAARALGRWQRAMAFRIIGEEIPEPEPFNRRRGFFGWLRGSFGDRAAWRAVAYFVAKMPLTLFGVWFAFGVWIEAIVDTTSPLTGSSGAFSFGVFGRFLRGGAPVGPSAHVGIFVTGVVALFVAPWTMRLVVHVDRRMMHLLLGPDAAASRVRSLEQSRSRTLDAATDTLRRIERNLHDGTQAQLVALAMRLGQAKDKLEQMDPEDRTAELEIVQRLIDEAHRGAKEAITDLRDLARGIHPPALDTGLENAFATLAARSPVPTEVTVSIQSRYSPAIEAISYFCAAELLANVAQHAQASRASVTCAQHGPWLRIVVRDNGRGGAAVHRSGSSSSGLAGLADRVAAVDGYFSVASPVGGPTVVTVDIPCHP